MDDDGCLAGIKRLKKSKVLGGLLLVAQTLLNPFRFALMHSCA